MLWSNGACVPFVSNSIAFVGQWNWDMHMALIHTQILISFGPVQIAYGLIHTQIVASL